MSDNEQGLDDLRLALEGLRRELLHTWQGRFLVRVVDWLNRLLNKV